jgi:hypothetical protein
MSEPLELDEETRAFAELQRREYGKWEAAELITVGNAPAYNEGDPVPISNVDAHGYARRGQVRLQHAWVENNPDDDDVKTFLGYAEKYPDHPTVKAWKRYEEEHAAAADEAEHLPPLTFGAEEKPKPTKKSTAAATRAEIKTADADAPKKG